MINSANEILSDARTGIEIEYSTQNKIEIQPGDEIFGMINDPIRGISMLFEASKASEENVIYFKKVLDQSKKVNVEDFSEIQAVSDRLEANNEDIGEISEESYKTIKARMAEKIYGTEKNSDASIDKIEVRKIEFQRFILYSLGLQSTRQVADLDMISNMAIEEGAISKSVYLVDEIEEYREIVKRITESDSYNKYKTERKEKSPSSGLACDQGITNYEKFLIHFTTDETDVAIPICETSAKSGYVSNFSRNKIYFGAPGTGKSNEIIKDLEKIGVLKSKDYERVTFHPDYSYASFVGTYKPVPFVDRDGKDSITYEYVPGPFTRILVKAYKSARVGEKKPYVLVIEEINRANVAAVFGDVFQLLDRNKDHISQYAIQASEDLKKYLAKEDVLGGEPDNYSQLLIPDNMFIWASMNSADQGVFPMDTAFKRRWDFKYIGIDENEADLNGKKVLLGKEPYSHMVEWNQLRKAINKFLADEKINEDKQLGPYFLSREIVVPAGGSTEIDSELFCEAFKNKVLMYLFEDAARQKRPSLFTKDPSRTNRSMNRYSDVCDEFDEMGVMVFCNEIVKESKIEELSDNKETN